VGRGVLSALGIDFDLRKNDVAARGNFCTVDEQGRVIDRRAGRIPTEISNRLCELLNEKVKIPGVEVFLRTVKEYRFLLVIRGEGLGVALLVSTLAVFFPDVADLYPVVLTAWMYLTPIIMPLDFYGEILNGLLLYINPFYYIVNLFRILMLDGFVPHLQTWIATAVSSFGILIIGWIFFTIKADDFAYNT